MKSRTLLAAGAAVAVAVPLIAVTTGCVSSFGQPPKGDDLARIKGSMRYGEGSFVNPVDTLNGIKGGLFGLIKRYMVKPDPKPRGIIPVSRHDVDAWKARQKQGVRFVWVNHATVLVEVDGVRILTDPIWSERCSPVGFAGPKRYHAPGIALADLPEIDAVIISHDHYDHLDEATVLALNKRNIPFYVPLGVGSHFKRWGIKRVHEMDWWQHVDLKTPTGQTLTLGPTPARHFSGRSVSDRNATLWASWGILGPKSRVWFGGDTGYFDGFKDIGERMGPFDLTIVPIGAYDDAWADIHLNPEEAVQTHQDVKGGLMVPIHWGTFDLAVHAWDDPVWRLVAAADAAQVQIVLPKPGETVAVGEKVEVSRWWDFEEDGAALK